MSVVPEENASLRQLQIFHSKLDEEKDFDKDLLRNVAFLSGEIGELVRVIQDIRKAGNVEASRGLKDRLGEELADILAYILKIANYSNVDLEEAYLRKMRTNITRAWRKRNGAG